MSLYETIASRLIGTPLQRPAEWLRGMRGARFRREHPELGEWFSEGERTRQVLERVLEPATNCIDIGCHIGSFLQTIVVMAPQGKHYAVEPVAHKAEWLQKKFAGVTVLQVALGDSDGVVPYFVNDAQTSYSGLKPRAVPGKVQQVEVQRRKLDDLIPADARIGFIKIDVNGGELGALQGAKQLLARDRPFVLLECTQGGLTDYGLHSDQVYRFVVEDAGFRIRLLSDYLAGGPPLTPEAFHQSMQYPFKAFNFAVTAA